MFLNDINWLFLLWIRRWVRPFWALFRCNLRLGSLKQSSTRIHSTEVYTGSLTGSFVTGCCWSCWTDAEITCCYRSCYSMLSVPNPVHILTLFLFVPLLASSIFPQVPILGHQSCCCFMEENVHENPLRISYVEKDWLTYFLSM